MNYLTIIMRKQYKSKIPRFEKDRIKIVRIMDRCLKKYVKFLMKYPETGLDKGSGEFVLDQRYREIWEENEK